MTDGAAEVAHEVVLVGCTATKRDEECEARRLYDESALFRKRRNLTTEHYWGILSAEYGLVDPRETIEPYDTHIKDRDSEEWAQHVLDDLLPALGEIGATSVKILAGKRYVDPLTPDLEAEGYEVLDPLRGLGIGERMSKLDEMANRTLEGFA